MRHSLLPLVVCGLLLPATGKAAESQRPPAPPANNAVNPDPQMLRPIAAYDSVFIEELTWLEVRDALRSGKTTAIIATGGIEMNGPYLATGKHNYILRATTEAIARRLGNALVAPIVPFVPEGQIDPPTEHMRYPGTISVTDETYRRLLTDIASSLRAHGFKHIILIGDSGGNQQGMQQVAEELGRQWRGGPTSIHFVREYYAADLKAWLRNEGIREQDEGHHDDYAMSAMMMTVDPQTVRMRERVANRKFSINSVPLAPAKKTIALGKRLIAHRAEVTAAAIRKAIDGQQR